MDLQQFLSELLIVVIIPLMGVLTKYLVTLIQGITDDLKVQKDIKNNVLIKGYIEDIETIIIKAVETTNQEYTNVLKANGEWSKENFRTAFNITKDKVMKLLTEENKELIKTIYNDIDSYIETVVESYISKK